ncbi:prepilin peptidase [Anaerocolumna xylanovorans]|uniref:Leader peptidase (Prepilin peptidase) / N-methyltransferase n=1 Tax=Anaerocolumna xylanovorans DSM 12503 TaxID=1121345 RepID=A0A1M7YJN9_9FIRM|nr:A24 family peptidase [Anaerocolumna xylanovorans]SHO52820.1 leader peptidase (prepilin peptidase) / N-methyltransferase [Anaerocolumna xylanovorans DSM 12503]
MSWILDGIVIFILLIGVIVYLSWDKMKETAGFKQKWAVLCGEEDKKKLYWLVMLCAGIILMVWMQMLYGDRSNLSMGQIKVLTLVMILFACAWTDMEKYIIPNFIILIGAGIRLLYYIPELILYQAGFFSVLKDDLIGILVVAAFLLIGLLIVRSGLGMGDVKLLLVMAFYQGLTGIISSLFFSLLIAFVGSVYLLVTKKKKRKDTIPFAPFILAGTYLSIILTGF